AKIPRRASGINAPRVPEIKSPCAPYGTDFAKIASSHRIGAGATPERSAIAPCRESPQGSGRTYREKKRARRRTLNEEGDFVWDWRRQQSAHPHLVSTGEAVDHH